MSLRDNNFLSSSSADAGDARQRTLSDEIHTYAGDGVINKNGFFKTAVISRQAEVDAKYFEETFSNSRRGILSFR